MFNFCFALFFFSPCQWWRWRRQVADRCRGLCELQEPQGSHTAHHCCSEGPLQCSQDPSKPPQHSAPWTGTVHQVAIGNKMVPLGWGNLSFWWCVGFDHCLDPALGIWVQHCVIHCCYSVWTPTDSDELVCTDTLLLSQLNSHLFIMPVDWCPP